MVHAQFQHQLSSFSNHFSCSLQPYMTQRASCAYRRPLENSPTTFPWRSKTSTVAWGAACTVFEYIPPQQRPIALGSLKSVVHSGQEGLNQELGLERLLTPPLHRMWMVTQAVVEMMIVLNLPSLQHGQVVMMSKRTLGSWRFPEMAAHAWPLLSLRQVETVLLVGPFHLLPNPSLRYWMSESRK